MSSWRKFYNKWLGDGIGAGLLDAITWITVLLGMLAAIVFFVKSGLILIHSKSKTEQEKKVLKKESWVNFIWALLCAAGPFLITVIYTLMDAFGLSQITGGIQPNFKLSSLMSFSYVRIY